MSESARKGESVSGSHDRVTAECDGDEDAQIESQSESRTHTHTHTRTHARTHAGTHTHTPFIALAWQSGSALVFPPK